jgi:branched-chain amino acid aminotransferase
MANGADRGFDSLKVWLDGKLVDFRDANVPILTHSLQYGSGIFEGIRAYDTPRGSAVFRLDDHIRRFLNSAKIHYMRIPFNHDELCDAVKYAVRENNLKSAYIRPFAFYNDSNIGLATKGKKTSVYIAAVPFGNYFGHSKDTGIKCKVSSWRRIGYSIIPVEAKASGNYLNSILASNEVAAAGFDEAILLSHDGYIAEGPGENIFLVRDGILYTPDEGSDILQGITRDSIIKIADALGLEVIQRRLHREMLYTSDEVFFCGSAAEITPIIEVDRIKIGDGMRGPITKKLAAAYSNAAAGKDKRFAKWLSHV